MKKVSDLQDYYKMKYVGAFDCHLEDALMAYTLSYAKKGKTGYRQEIYVKDLKTQTEKKISVGGLKETNPQISPDGKHLSLLSKTTNDFQIFIYSLKEGRAKQLTEGFRGVRDVVWSPDGQFVAFLAYAMSDKADQQRGVAHYENKALKKPVIIEDYGYKSEEAMGFSKKQSTQLWIADVETGKITCLTEGDRDHVMPTWSPDGKRIVFASNRCRNKNESIAMDLFSVTLADGVIERLTESVWIAYYPVPFYPLFTPDGAKLVFGALAPSLEGGMPRTLLYTMPSEGGEITNIFPVEAPCHEATCFIYNSENYGSKNTNAQINEKGDTLFFISGWQGACDIYCASLTGEPFITKITSGQHSFRSIEKVADDKIIASKGTFVQTPQIYEIDRKTGQETILVESNPWLKKIQMSHPVEMWVDTLDGEGKIQGWIIPPQKREKDKKYPAILYVHGGPTPFYGYALTYEHQILAAQGFAVMMCNPRGSSGYGAKHQDMVKAFDNIAMYDLLQFVDEACRKMDWIDSNRIGVTGGSYGGYMTNWLAAHTNKFKAAVTQRSLTNFLISYASSDMAGSSKDFDSFTDFMVNQIRKSPVAYAEKINIPFLILHSENDMRCPVEGAHQLFVAIKDTHPELPVRMVLFPKSNHNLLNSGEMHLRIRHYQEMIHWFQKYL